MSARFDSGDVVRLDGLEALVKAVKMKPIMAKIGILGNHTARREAEKNARSFAKTLGASKKYSLTGTKKGIKEAAGTGAFGSTNAAIGAAHEFGSVKRNLPKRSFLREPLIENLQAALDSAGAFSPHEQAEIIKQKSLLPWTRKMAIMAENIVKKAFETNGYGKWKDVADATMDRKTTSLTLVETTQLRDSITSEVKANT